MEATPPASLFTIDQRYICQARLGEGGQGEVYRAWDRLTQQPVALKRLLDYDPADADARHNLIGEFQVMASLRHPHIVTVQQFAFEGGRGQPYFTMELLPNPQTICAAAREQPLAKQVQLWQDMLLALSYLHRQHIVHADLKPSNVLVVNGQVKVVDFGAAIQQGQISSVGTIFYLAPEALTGWRTGQRRVAHPRLDLYAAGVILVEMLTGRNPFADCKTIEALVAHTPTLTPLPAPLQPLAARLLAKDPAQRYPNAEAVLGELCAAMGWPLPPDTVARRESFLQNARFVGRAAELEQLTVALNALQQGRGGLWLVGGESGVGKSRLLHEMRTHALVAGVIVARGQAVREGSQPYQVWQQPLRRLCLHTALSDTEASVLQAVVPDLPTLLDRPLPDAPPLPPQAQHERLQLVILDLFKRQTQPLLVCLEDLHWADSPSLKLLAELQRPLSTQPILVVGNYRADEAPQFATQWPQAHTLLLTRFTAPQLTELSQAILGESGQRAALLAFLQRETEGNAFFVVETLRALAEEAGALALVGQRALPEQVLTGGVQQVLARRLRQMPTAARPLLALAAVAGRWLDLRVLKHLAGSQNLETWLQTGLETMVLAVHDHRWGFAHDKLREAVLAEVPAAQRPQLHAQVATALEQAYPAAPEHWATLAAHWQAAQNPAKTFDYSLRAGEQALQNYAIPEAQALLLAAQNLLANGSATAPALLQAQLAQLLAQVYMISGKYGTACQHLAQALRHLGQPVPKAPPALGFALFSSILRQALHRHLPRPLRALARVGRPPPPPAQLQAIAQCYYHLCEAAYFINQIPLLLYSVFEAVNWSEQAPPAPDIARLYGSAAVGAGMVQFHAWAQTYLQLGTRMAEQLNHPSAYADLLHPASTYWLSRGDFAQARHAAAQATALSAQVNNLHVWHHVHNVWMATEQQAGHFAASAHIARQGLRTARQRHPAYLRFQLISMLPPLTRVLSLQNKPQAALALAAHIEPLARAASVIGALTSYGYLAVTYLQCGQWAAAQTLVAEIERLSQKQPPTLVFALEAYAIAAYFYLTLWEQNRATPALPLATLQAKAHRACRVLGQYAFFHRVGRPRAALWQGLRAWLQGQTQQAHRLWHKSLRAATQRQMPYEMALAHLELGRHPLPHTSPAETQHHLQQATTLFAQVGALYDVQRVEAVKR